MSDETAEARRVERALSKVTEGHDEPMEAEPHPDRTRTFSSLNFARMPTRWKPDEQVVIDGAIAQAEQELSVHFADAYIILNRIYEIVREPLTDADGVVATDRHGFAVWRRDEFGMPVEDWSRLTERDKERFLHEITTRLVLWEQRAAEFWGHAMFAKAAWEERFATAFLNTPREDKRRPTEADRTQYGQMSAREDRYLAIYMSVRSRKADALVRSLERLSQRLKDTSR